MTKRALLAASAALLLLLTGCSAPAADPQPDKTSKAPDEPVEIPATSAGTATQWVLDQMNADADTDAADWTPLLTDAFQAEVSAEDVATLINRQIRPARPLVPTAYRGTETESVTTIAGKLGDPFDLTIVVDADERVSTLFIAPAAPPHEPAESTGEVAERLAALPGDTRVHVDLDGEEVLVSDPDAVAPLGSIFKLYVLGAVADAVAAGTADWDDRLTVTDDVRSLPSGELQDAPSGTTVTVREAADKMISISDNTATDLLIAHVGRKAVEKAVEEMEHHDPAAMRPFLTTREMFALTAAPNADLREKWESAGESERRELLVQLAERPFTVTAADFGADVLWPTGLEWFASAADVARAHDALSQRATDDEAVRAALTRNRGVSIDKDAWPVVAFKGGSDNGVLASSWHAERADGKVLTVVVLSSDDVAIASSTQAELFGLVEDLFALLAE